MPVLSRRPPCLSLSPFGGGGWPAHPAPGQSIGMATAPRRPDTVTRARAPIWSCCAPCSRRAPRLRHPIAAPRAASVVPGKPARNANAKEATRAPLGGPHCRRWFRARASPCRDGHLATSGSAVHSHLCFLSLCVGPCLSRDPAILQPIRIAPHCPRSDQHPRSAPPSLNPVPVPASPSGRLP